VNKEQYQAWANHPQTKQFFKYLEDYRQDLMERWAQGSLQGDDNIAAIARSQMADEISNLADDAIEEFYKSRKVEVQDAE